MASPQVAQAKTAGSALDQIDAFLSQVTGEYEKHAAESQKDKPENTSTEQAKPKAGDGSTSQRSLGKEQTDAAEASGSTIAKVSPNSDDGGPSSKQPGDGKSDQPQQSSPGESSGNAQAARHEATVQEKIGRTIRLGNAILNKLAAAQPQAPAPKPAAKPAAAAPQGASKEGADAFIQKCAAIAEAKAIEYRDGYLYGMLKRAQDEAELANVDWAKLGVTKEAMDAVGGTSGLLDKIADEDPDSVMPEELAGAGGPPPEAAAAPAEGGGDSLDQAADALAAAGVQPQDIDQAAQALNELFQSGVTPEEAAQAVKELVDEQSGGGAGGPPGVEGMLPPPAAEEAAEAPVEEAAEAPAEEVAEGEKAASDNTRMNVIKGHLRGNLK